MRKFFRIASIIWLVLWMGFIFFLSAQTADESSDTSGSVAEIIAEKFYHDYEELSQTEKSQVISSMQFYVRKSAHLAVFAVLGVSAFLVFISYVNLHFSSRMFLAITVSCLYAASDEFHQRFVAGRSCELRDFLLDSAGIVAAVLISSAFILLIAPLRRKSVFSGIDKKKLKAINIGLCGEVDNLHFQNAQLKEEIDQKNFKIENLEKDLKRCLMAENKPTDNFESKIVFAENESLQFSDEVEYAAKVIGSAVVRVTEVCNIIMKNATSTDCKDLVNLALGRNEVLKSEIFNISQSDKTFEEKKLLCDDEKREAFDYFDSIIAQIC